MKYRISNDEIKAFNESNSVEFPKYTSQLINWANQNAQGTRPKVVGQLSELFPEFVKDTTEMSIEAWEKWYKQRFPEAVELATAKIYAQVQNLQHAIHLINYEMVKDWVEDLVITKTYNGLYVQQAVLASYAKRLNKTYRLANPLEESKGIDGYVGEEAYSIKPMSYKLERRLSEVIDVTIIYYEKKKDGLVIEIEE